MHSSRPNSYRLVQMHRLSLLRLMRCLLHPLAFLFPMLSVLLFLDVYLLDLSSPFVVGC